jgi:hypothetical protein
MRIYVSTLLIGMIFSLNAFAQKKVAVVKLIKGEVNILTLGKTAQLKVDDWVEEGAVVQTADKSFVKLIFIDKSQMNVGPNSEMKIESFSGKDSGVIDLVKGKIRSQVTKDYLQMEDKDKSKMFVKTKNAVMGVRGTDFMIASNGKISSIVLFEGEVSFSKLNNHQIKNSDSLERIVDRGVRIFPGEFSVVEAKREPTIPSLLNVHQKEALEKSDDSDVDRGPSNESDTSEVKSIVPKGLTGKVVSNNSETLQKEVNQAKAKNDLTESRASENPEGFVRGDKVKPANGSFLHLASGVIIPPSQNAVLDKSTNTFLETGSSNGKVSSNGEYIPPANVEITREGKILVSVAEIPGVNKLIEVSRPVPVLGKTGLDNQFTQTNGSNSYPNHFQPRPYDMNTIPGYSNLPTADLKLQNQIENVRSTTNTTIRVRAGN